MLNLYQLKTSLAECHVKSEDDLSKVLRDSNPQYQVARAREELALIPGSTPEKTIERLTLAIQLLNMARAATKDSISKTQG